MVWSKSRVHYLGSAAGAPTLAAAIHTGKKRGGKGGRRAGREEGREGPGDCAGRGGGAVARGIPLVPAPLPCGIFSSCSFLHPGSPKVFLL